MDEKKRKTRQIIVILLAVCILTVTTTTAYFIVNVTGTNQTATLTTGTMALTFADNDNGINEKLMFGDSVTKKFTIENTGTLETSLSLDWLDLVNTYTNGSLTYILEWSEAEEGPYETLIDTTNVPVSTDPFMLPISSEISVPAGTKYYYNLTITLENLSDVDQTIDLDAVFHTKFTIDQPSKYRYYALVVDPSGGTWDTYTASQTYLLKNDETKSIPEPTREGYVFDGWNITSLAGELSNNTFTMGISNARLVAKWKPASYTLTIDPAGGTYSGSTSIELEYLSSTELTSNPTREGYTFIGWDVTGGQLSDTTFTQTEAKNSTLTAKWEVNNYKYIVYHYQQSVDGSEYTLVDGDTDEGEAAYNSTVTPDRKTYTGFTSPEGTALTIKAETTYPPILNKADYEYARNKYTLTVEVGNGTYSGEMIPSDGIYYESQVNLGTPTNPTGYTFANWSATSGSITDNTYTMSNATDDTVTANYTPNEYSVTFNANGGTVGTQSTTVTYDSTYGTLPTPTYSGYNFTGWYTAQTGGTQITSTTTVKITESQTLYAQWEKVIEVNTMWTYEYGDDGNFKVPEDGQYQIEMHGGGGGGGIMVSSMTDYGLLKSAGGGGGGSGEMYSLTLQKGEIYTITVGAGGNQGKVGEATTFGEYSVAGGGAGATSAAGGASGSLATAGSIGESNTYAAARCGIGGQGNKNNTSQTYGDGGLGGGYEVINNNGYLVSDEDMIGQSGAVIITYLGKESS